MLFTNKYLKKYLVIREKQTKSVLKFHLTSIRYLSSAGWRIFFFFLMTTLRKLSLFADVSGNENLHSGSVFIQNPKVLLFVFSFFLVSHKTWSEASSIVLNFKYSKHSFSYSPLKVLLRLHVLSL